MERQLYIHGIPKGTNENEKSLLRSRLSRDVGKFIAKNNINSISLVIDTDAKSSGVREKSDMTGKKTGKLEDLEEQNLKRALQYSSQKPSYNFSQLIVSKQVREDLEAAIDSVNVESVVFDSWGLRDIQPNPRTVLNFYGPPGTGKTLAAHSVADYLKKPILSVSYADIESKFHGDGPKNLKSMFYAAERDGALLFMDEADSLLSKRLTSVNTGSEQAINSMRSQLLICLEQFQGIVIFATNLVENYDKAFDTRVRHLHFPMPDAETRLKIWKCHLPQKLPLSKDVILEGLADIDHVCGRDIREAVIDASSRAALRAVKQKKPPEQGCVTNQDLVDAILRKKSKRVKSSAAIPPKEIEVAIKKQLEMSAC